MIITEVTYGKTINIGNYQSVRVDMTIRLEPGETHHDALDTLKSLIRSEEIVILRENTPSRK